MAMLAERREKKRYVLVPRGKALYEDSSRFGTRMLEKMGWSKGKGLGANEDGNLDFVRIRYKHDAEGLGYEMRDDQWTQHQTHFNGLLQSLNNSLENSEEESQERPTLGLGLKSEDKPGVSGKISGESLEEKSKKSRARVHYQKFTRGKDLTRYSEKDLANIFGKKSLAEDNPLASTFGGPISSGNSEENTNDADEEVKYHKFGITTVSTGTSVHDYFKEKMAKLKSGKGQKTKTSEILEEKDDTSTDLNNEKRSKKKKKNQSKVNEDIESEGFSRMRTRSQSPQKRMEIRGTENPEDSEQLLRKKKKKNKKQKDMKASGDLEESENYNTAEITLIDCKNEEIEVAVSKKSKKRKRTSLDLALEGETKNNKERRIMVSETGGLSDENEDAKKESLVVESFVKENKSKRKKKSKRGDKDQEERKIESAEQEEIKEVRKEKKAKTAFQLEESLSKERDLVQDCQQHENKSSKKKAKNKEKSFQGEEIVEEQTEIEVIEKKSKTKNVALQEKSEENSEGGKISEDFRVNKSKNSALGEKLGKNSVDVEETDKKKGKDESQPEGPSSKKKSKKSKKSPEDSEKVDPQPPPEESQKSLETPNASNAEFPQLNTSKFLKKYTISSFAAEKFRYTNLDCFVGSNFKQITGYGLAENVELEVLERTKDEQKIVNFWDAAMTNKYDVPTDGGSVQKNNQKKRRPTVRKLKKKKTFIAI